MHVPDNSSHPDKRSHRQRGLRRRRKFQAEIVQGLRSIEGVEYLGKCTRTRAILAEHGLPIGEIGVHRVALRGTVLHVIGISNRLWYSQQHGALKTALSRMGARGHRFATIPQRAIEGLLDSPNTSAAMFFDMVLHRAIRTDVGELRPCAAKNHEHDPVGCFAVALSTGAACLG
jgi:hypothetical protein